MLWLAEIMEVGSMNTNQKQSIRDQVNNILHKDFRMWAGEMVIDRITWTIISQDALIEIINIKEIIPDQYDDKEHFGKTYVCYRFYDDKEKCENKERTEYNFAYVKQQ